MNQIDDCSLELIDTHTIDLLILHNYDIYLETMHGSCYPINRPTKIIMMVQTEINESSTGESWLFNQIERDAHAFCSDLYSTKTMSTVEVFQQNRLRGIQCVEKEVRCDLTPLQKQLLKRCSNNNLKMFILIHPCLLLDKKLKVKGDQKV